jgi:2,3-bisphosphoglycerate-independent phosphoglycerate mutase
MADKQTAILVIMDGLGDRPTPKLGNKTPLEYAKTPTFDRLAKEGQTGLMNVIGPGITPGSDTAHLALFGFDPHDDYPGRGPLEAQGAGLTTKPGDVAFRSNFATIDDNFIVQDRRAGREFSDEEGAILQSKLDGLTIEDVTVRFIHTVEHRGALVLDGKGLSAKITDIDPHETGLKVLTCQALVPEAEKTARIVNELIKKSYTLLKDLDVNKKRIERGLPPANVLLLRGQGQHMDSPTLTQKYGIKSAVLAGGALYIGTAKYVGMIHVPVEGQTGTIDTNFDNIASKAIESIPKYDYVFVHIKATDNAGHDRDEKQKVFAIEHTDAMVGKIIAAAGDEIVIAIAGDHSTPVTVGEHTCDPVPIILWSKNMRPDKTERYSEIEASTGGLGMLHGMDVMPLLLGYSGRLEKYGA